MKHLLLSFLFLLHCTIALAQTEPSESILRSPDHWKSEVIPFPLGFAPDIAYTGFEELRFRNDWSKQESEDFWTYAFAWYIEETPEWTAEGLEADFKRYYDGLMSAVAEGKDYGAVNPASTKVLFWATGKGEAAYDFFGKMRMFDSFWTGAEIMLNVRAKAYNCPDTGKHLVLFHLSPQPFGHPIWETFSEITFTEDCE